jgi:hypothetical protein
MVAAMMAPCSAATCVAHRDAGLERGGVSRVASIDRCTRPSSVAVSAIAAMLPAKLELNKRFQPCPVKLDEEMYPNGIFVFNITQLQAFMDADAERFAVEQVAVEDIPNYGPPAEEKTIRCADLSRPIVLAEISPARFNLIDGHPATGTLSLEVTLPAYRTQGKALSRPQFPARSTRHAAYKPHTPLNANAANDRVTMES